MSFNYGWRASFARTGNVYTVDLPISGRWIEVKESIIKEVVLPHLYEVAEKLRKAGGSIPEFYRIKGEFHGIDGKLCSSPEMLFSEMIARPFLNPDDIVFDGAFVLLHVGPASKGLLQFASKHYARQFPRLRRGAHSAPVSSHITLTAHEIGSLSMEEQSIYIARCASAACNAEPDMYLPTIVSLEKEETRALESQLLEEATAAGISHEQGRALTEIPLKNLRPAYTEAEKRQAMITADGQLVVHRFVVYH